MAKTGPLHEFEDPFSGRHVFLEDLRSGDVGRHEVRGELDSLEREIENFGERRYQKGLRETGDADEKGMGPAEDRDQELFDHFVLADDDLVELAPHVGVGLLEFFNGILVGTGQLGGLGRSGSVGHVFAFFGMNFRGRQARPEAGTVSMAGGKCRIVLRGVYPLFTTVPKPNCYKLNRKHCHFAML